MNNSMTAAEINRAATLLDDDGKAELDKVRIGRWAIANDRGLYGVYDTKAEAIDTALSNHCQLREFCKVKRQQKGVYSLAILDCDEDPAEKFYHHFNLEQITSDNILEFKELALGNLLPDWFYNPYSVEYKEYNATQTTF